MFFDDCADNHIQLSKIGLIYTTRVLVKVIFISNQIVTTEFSQMIFILLNILYLTSLLVLQTVKICSISSLSTMFLVESWQRWQLGDPP